MPTINDSTVVASAYITSASARPQRLSNGWIVSVEYNSFTTSLMFQVNKNDGNGFISLCFIKTLSSVAINSFTISSVGTKLYVVAGIDGGTDNMYSWYFDATTVTNIDMYATNRLLIDNQTDIFSANMIVNSLGTELHISLSSKNTTYPNSQNIRYVKGTISAVDGSVAWGTVLQRTTENSSGVDCTNPCIVCNSSNQPVITFMYNQGTTFNHVHCHRYTGSTWATEVDVYTGNGYIQYSPSVIFVPQSINGLANGRIWVAWHGTDSTDTTRNNIRVSYSDDNGVTWSAMQKLTSGNLYHQAYPSITCNMANEICIVHDGIDATAPSYYNIRKIKNISGAWGSSIKITANTTGQANTSSILYSPTFNYTEPLFIYQNNQTSKVGFYGSWTVTTISVAQGSIGAKSDKTNLLSYVITTDGTMSTITESVNGVTIGTKTATSGQSLVAGLTQAQWDAVKYGKYKDATGGLNTLTVSMGTDTWTYTFDKRLATSDDINKAMQSVADMQSTMLPSVKSQLGSAIRGKGGTVNDTDSWDAIVSSISNMTNKKWATGTVVSSASADPNFIQTYNSATISMAKITITGLTFKPSFILIKCADENQQITYDNRFSSVYRAIMVSSKSAMTPNVYSIQEAGTLAITTTGFVMPVFSGSTSYTWIAIE